jgi:hypothetical protein
MWIDACHPHTLNKFMFFADAYDNAVVLPIGTIVYKADCVSLVNSRIMRWLVYDLELRFDYFVTFGGVAYLLQDAHDLAYSLQGKRGDEYGWETNSPTRVTGSSYRKTAVCDANDSYLRVVVLALVMLGIRILPILVLRRTTNETHTLQAITVCGYFR